MALAPVFNSEPSRAFNNDASRIGRLPWLLLFRVLVATVFLVLTIVADAFDWPLRRISILLYVIVVINYVIVALLGAALKAGAQASILSAVHLASAIFVAGVIVYGTGGVLSPFSFFYLLAIVDGAIVGSRPVALVVASASVVAYGTQLALQLYTVLPMPGVELQVSDTAYGSAFVVHLGAAYLLAGLAGYLAEQLERARAEASDALSDLMRAERYQGELLAALPVGVLTYDGQGDAYLMNHAAKSILGTDERRFDVSGCEAEVRDFFDGDTKLATVKLKTQNGMRIISFSRASSAYLTIGERKLQTIVVDDETEVTRLASDLESRKRLAAIGALSAGIAHEIRNPLASISGSLELLERTQGARRETLQSIVRREIERLNKLVEDFLAYAKPTSPSLTSTDLCRLVRETVAMAKQSELGRNVDMQCELPSELFANIDGDQFRQLLWNLLRNACEAVREGQSVFVNLSHFEGGFILEIEDEGEGIPDAIRESLFEPFRTSKEGGTGLGLATVQRIVDAHEGRIRIDSDVGMGTKIVVEIPN